MYLVQGYACYFYSVLRKEAGHTSEGIPPEADRIGVEASEEDIEIGNVISAQGDDRLSEVACRMGLP